MLYYIVYRAYIKSSWESYTNCIHEVTYNAYTHLHNNLNFLLCLLYTYEPPTLYGKIYT
jgi:hypothetical protein